METTINLKKGQTINLSKETNGSQKFQIRAGWDVGFTQYDFDVDVMACKEEIGKEGAELIYYNKKESSDGAIKLSGDNRTGEGDGWDETIYIDGSLLSKDTKRIPCIISIYEATERGQNFGLVRNLKVQIYDETNNVEVANYEPELDFGLDTAVVLGEFVVSNGNLYFKPLGQGYNNIMTVLQTYKAR